MLNTHALQVRACISILFNNNCMVIKSRYKFILSHKSLFKHFNSIFCYSLGKFYNMFGFLMLTAQQ